MYCTGHARVRVFMFAIICSDMVCSASVKYKYKVCDDDDIPARRSAVFKSILRPVRCRCTAAPYALNIHDYRVNCRRFRDPAATGLCVLHEITGVRSAIAVTATEATGNRSK